MRRPWIKIEVSTPDKPEVCAISTRLKISEDAVMGKLVRLWSWLEINRVNPDDLGVTFEFLDKLVSKKGFAAAMEEAGWLKAEGEVLSLPKFAKYNGNDAKVRGLTAKRVARHRQRKLAEQTGQTPPAPPKKKKEVPASPVIKSAEKAPQDAPPAEEPARIEPEAIEPEAIEPEAIEPEAVEPEAVEPEAVEPEAIEPEAIEPEAIEPEAIEPEAIEPEAIEPEAVEPEAVEPEAIEPEAIEPEAVEPEPSESIPTMIASLDAVLENEPSPKRRSKAERQNENQPMLF